MGKVIMTFEADESLKNRLEQEQASTNLNKSQVIRRACEEYLDRKSELVEMLSVKAMFKQILQKLN